MREKEEIRNLRTLYDGIEINVEPKSIAMIFTEKKECTYNFKPNYQRNYVWSAEKGSNLIETILINNQFPPLIVFVDNNTSEIIDGRQRIETIVNFVNNKFVLKYSGLSVLKDLAGCKYDSLPANVREIFDSYILSFIVYRVKINICPETKDLIKRDLFRRYNIGMTSLSQNEIARAVYVHDNLTNLFQEVLDNDKNFQEICEKLFVKSSKRKGDNRERKNNLLVEIRKVLSMYYMPIIDNKSISFSGGIIDEYYENFVLNEQRNDKVIEFKRIVGVLFEIKQYLTEIQHSICENVMFYRSVYWMLSILYKEKKLLDDFDVYSFCKYIEENSNSNEFFDDYKEYTSKRINGRHSFLKNYLTVNMRMDLSSYFNDLKKNKITKNVSNNKSVKNMPVWEEIKKYPGLNIREASFDIRYIIRLLNNNQLVIRPDYQRAEVKSRIKASLIVQSVILGVKFPPIFAYAIQRDDGLTKYELIDGQQRLISILSFITEVLKNDNDILKTSKKLYKLSLGDDPLNGRTFNDMQLHHDKIYNYLFNFIIIEKRANENFNPIDMFLRLNSKPMPILPNTFEMWNSFNCVKILDKVKIIAKKYSNDIFMQKGKKMKDEELIITLAYMEYKDINLSNLESFLKVYIKAENIDNPFEKRYEIKLSIDKKYELTNFLKKINSIDEEKMLNSLEKIIEFADKLKLLIKNDSKILIKILNPYLSNPRKGQVKDFYILWIILKYFDKYLIESYSESILDDIEMIFKIMKQMPENTEINYFYNFVQEKINQYNKYNSMSKA